MHDTLSASFGSGETAAEILRFAQDDSQDSAQARSREVFSPNVYRSEEIISSGRLATDFFGEVNLSFSASNNLDVAPAGGFT